MSSDWSYDGDSGPENWYKKFQFCAGKRQSPIDILPAETTVEKRKLQNNYYNQPENLTFVLKNNGHSAQVDIGNATGLYSNAFGQTFKPVQVHFHWGRNDSVGSEHTINGSQYPAEMHFVHMNKKYSTAEEAVKNQDGLLVLGTFITIGIESSEFKPIFDALEEVEGEGETKAIDALKIVNLMPDNKKEFYFYNGSLTTPGCNQAVKWIVFKDEICISALQMEKLRALKHHGDKGEASISNNFRPTQALNGRKVKRTFSL